MVDKIELEYELRFIIQDELIKLDKKYGTNQCCIEAEKLDFGESLPYIGIQDSNFDNVFLELGKVLKADLSSITYKEYEFSTIDDILEAIYSIINDINFD